MIFILVYHLDPETAEAKIFFFKNFYVHSRRENGMSKEANKKKSFLQSILIDTKQMIMCNWRAVE
ncbi:hypothetical protein T4D_1981 [Trichinella pseudospiralis]|uniref:Uncharacterized protein n=1 Tax=Trichinella pseudospiralis TaxID=6337 RepID=A0A0V1F992_TRIPS|nr:hypothetical protein T4D_1981 [Trichinella pseudospiralis]